MDVVMSIADRVSTGPILPQPSQGGESRFVGPVVGSRRPAADRQPVARA